MKDKTLEYLINNSCPTIAMRIREEIYEEKLSKAEKVDYFTEIINQTTVKKVLEWQGKEGYFGTRFHTPPSNSKVWSHEGCVRYLLELGLDLSFLPLKKALDVLLLEGWEKECTGKAAEIFGAGNIKASLFAQAGLEDYDFMKQWIEVALQAFRFIYEAHDLTDIAIPYKDKQIFVEGKYLPIIYHLRILAFTYSWRNDKNIAMIMEAFNKLYKWLPIKPIYIKYKSQLIAPGGNIAYEYNNDLFKIEKKFAFHWLSFYELIARMGMLYDKSPFRKHFESLLSYLKENHGFFLEKYDKKAFVYWSGYSGMSLEDNWRSHKNQINDLTFRVCLIEALADRACIY
ncbi:hypothetical protein GCM10023142_15240 [Anaerocolumna aminovalerica]|uniref:Uncharacterized protein n=1 Tax=Anaerocolumna aminovalerica TaxID=1527 RepID=A0A1I5BYY6_9FIRM|nr:hypothetical protein [Anaerocolumna aminovalerica]MBU5334591.1 hypothetical protein [Anaerocolumna aminovalerica]SFN79900.1 hypothetical protein SAMN04489757_1027 [Anaerocolumna aminovalerica]